MSARAANTNTPLAAVALPPRRCPRRRRTRPPARPRRRAAAAEATLGGPLSPALLSPQRKSRGGGSTHNVLKARDVRKVDPAFAARLEPAIIVRAGCVIISLGKMTELRAIITREKLYFVLPEGRVADSILAAFRTNLATLRAAEAERAAAERARCDAPSSQAGSPQASAAGGAFDGVGLGLGLSLPAAFEGQASPLGLGRPLSSKARSNSEPFLRELAPSPLPAAQVRSSTLLELGLTRTPTPTPTPTLTAGALVDAARARLR